MLSNCRSHERGIENRFKVSLKTVDHKLNLRIVHVHMLMSGGNECRLMGEGCCSSHAAENLHFSRCGAPRRPRHSSRQERKQESQIDMK